MEIGISKGQFSVIRLAPEAMPPDGGFVLRIADHDSGITVITHLRHLEGLELAKGFRPGDNEKPASLVVLPDDNAIAAANASKEEAPA